jgi:hypothetical protein
MSFYIDKVQPNFTKVRCNGEPGAGGAYLAYSIETDDCGTIMDIHFQNGHIQLNGVNGTFLEDLLCICRHRLECFQKGNFACETNQSALDHIKLALEALNSRTQDRKERNVLGTYEK